MLFRDSRCLALEANCAYVYCKPRDFRCLRCLILSSQWKSHLSPRRAFPPQRKSCYITRPELLSVTKSSDWTCFSFWSLHRANNTNEYVQFRPCISCVIETLLMKILSAFFADVLLPGNVTCTVADISMKAAGGFLVPLLSVESRQEYQRWRFSDHLRL